MKRISVIILIAVAIMGCTQVSVQPVSLNSKRDSVNYALGYIHAGLSANAVSKDSTGKALKVFISTFDRVAAGSMKKYSSSYRYGYQLGLGVLDYETSGLSHNPLWPVNEPLLLQGFISGYFGDTTIMTPKGVEQARNRANTIQTKAWITIYDPVKAQTCPTTVEPVVMENKVDSLNYAFGWSNGYQSSQVIAKDSTFCFDDYIAGMNKALRQRPDYPAAVNTAISLAIQTENWNQKGLDGKKFPYKSEIYRQALVNGLQHDTVTMRFYDAAKYLNATLPACLPNSIKRRL